LVSALTPLPHYSLRTQNQRPNAHCQGLYPFGRPLQLPTSPPSPTNLRQISALPVINPRFAESLGGPCHGRVVRSSMCYSPGPVSVHIAGAPQSTPAALST